MYHRVFLGLAIVAVLVYCAPAPATEPDGRVAFRYSWPDKTDSDPDRPRLRLSITAFADVSEARLGAALPKGIQLSVLAAGRAPAPWPEEGVAIGALAAGQTVVLDLDVAKGLRRADVLAFVLQGVSGGKTVREGVGVPVGPPAAGPTLRNGAAEFPAWRGDTAP